MNPDSLNPNAFGVSMSCSIDFHTFRMFAKFPWASIELVLSFSIGFTSGSTFLHCIFPYFSFVDLVIMAC